MVASVAVTASDRRPRRGEHRRVTIEWMGRLVDIGDTRLFVEEDGAGPALIVLHGGPGADHTQLKPYLLPLEDEFRVLYVDQRSQGRSPRTPHDTWTLEENAHDVTRLAEAVGLTNYALLGHSYGALVTLIHAIRFPGAARGRVVSQGVPSARWYRLEKELAVLEPSELREPIQAAWDELNEVDGAERMGKLIAQQMPFHFKDPTDPRVPTLDRQMRAMIHTPEVHRVMSERELSRFDLENELSQIRDPTLIIAGRYDRVCPPEASKFMSEKIEGAEFVIFENSGHVSYVEENDAYVAAVRMFLRRHLMQRFPRRLFHF